LAAVYLVGTCCAALLGLGAGAGAGADAASAASTRAELGRGTWTLLHRAAAKYPASPSAAERAQMTAWLEALAALYPCDDCAAHYASMLAASPVDASSGPALAAWLCARHNEVNARLGKPAFPCSSAALQERWGGCGCAEGKAGGELAVASTGARPEAGAEAAPDVPRTRGGRARRGPRHEARQQR